MSFWVRFSYYDPIMINNKDLINQWLGVGGVTDKIGTCYTD